MARGIEGSAIDMPSRRRTLPANGTCRCRKSCNEFPDPQHALARSPKAGSHHEENVSDDSLEVCPYLRTRL